MEFILGALIIGLIPAVIAYKKGYSFIAWWMGGALLFIVALPLAIIQKPNQEELEKRALSEGMKKCPYCAELVKGEAKICKHCKADISDVIVANKSIRQTDSQGRMLKICTHCGAKNRGEDHICYRCRQPLL